MNGKIILTVVGALAASLAVAADWDTVTVDDYQNEVGGVCTLVLDGAGYPHVAYCDAYNHGPRYAYFDGSAWHISLVERQDRGGHSSMALDARERPHISYTHCKSYRPFDAELKYAYFDGSRWHTEVVDDSAATGEPNSIALDSRGRPHISHHEYVGSGVGNLRYSYYDGSSWHTEVVDGRGVDIGHDNSIAIDSSDHPHISYHYCDWSNNYEARLMYARYDGSRWRIETVDGSPNTGKGTSLVLDSADRPHISYQEDLTEALKYAYFDGSRWHIEVIDDDHVQHNTSLVLDARGRPHITYCAQWGTGGPFWLSEFRYAYYDGAAWHKEVIEAGAEAETLGCWNSLALDAAGAPHVAYERCVGYESLGSVKYGRTFGSYLEYFTATPWGYDAMALKWAVKDLLGKRVTGYDLYRRPKGEEEWGKLTETPLAGGNSGSYDDGGLLSLRCYEYRLEAIVDGRPRELGVTEGTTGKPQAYVLHAARPNPASGKAVLAFDLADRADVELALYDLSGRRVATVARGWLPPGGHDYECDVSTLAPGVYIYRLEAGEWTAAKRMVVIR